MRGSVSEWSQTRLNSPAPPPPIPLFFRLSGNSHPLLLFQDFSFNIFLRHAVQIEADPLMGFPIFLSLTAPVSVFFCLFCSHQFNDIWCFISFATPLMSHANYFLQRMSILALFIAEFFFLHQFFIPNLNLTPFNPFFVLSVEFSAVLDLEPCKHKSRKMWKWAESMLC